MQVKKGMLGFFGILSTLIFVGCGQQAPDLSFEETLSAYNKQNQTIRSGLSLLLSPEGIISSSLQTSLNGEFNEGEQGNLVISSNSITETTTKNQETDLNISLDLNSKEAVMGTAVNATAKLNAKFIIKDYIPYFNLNTLEIKGNKTIEEQLSFFTAMTEGFKGKWLTFSGLNLEETLAQMQKHSILSGETMEDKVEYYTGISKTQYEGQPAWKVNFNMDIIKPDAKKIITQSLLTNGSSLGQNEQTIEELNKTIDSMKIENLEAYFVIYAQDNIKFVIKNGDIIISDPSSQEIKIHIEQTVKAKKYEGTLSVLPSLTGEENNEITLNYTIQEQGKGKYDFTVEIKNQEKKVLSLAGTLAFIVEKDALSIKPNIKLTIDTVKINGNGEFNIKKINEHTFTAPKDAEDIGNILGGMFGASPEIPELSGEETIN